jgi:hypothetical protein
MLIVNNTCKVSDMFISFQMKNMLKDSIFVIIILHDFL